MSSRTILLPAAMLASILVTVVAQPKHPRPTDQTHFNAEDGVRMHSIRIPANVLTILARDPMVSKTMHDADPALTQPSQSWFSAAKIHLAGPEENDLLVMAEGPFLGANVVNFWVFRLTPQGPNLVLDGPAHDLIISRTRWMGLRDVKLLSATATRVHTVLLRFNGERFVTFSDRWEDIK